MENYNEAINQIYNEKNNQVIIGLTGRTGAGCSTVAKILKKQFDDLELEFYDETEETLKEKKEFEIIKEYIAKDERWVPFEVIEVSCVILSYVFEFHEDNKKGLDRFIEYMKFLQSDKNTTVFKIDNFGALEQEIQGLRYIFEKVEKNPLYSDMLPVK